MDKLHLKHLCKGVEIIKARESYIANCYKVGGEE